MTNDHDKKVASLKTTSYKPVDWGGDVLTDFLQTAENNSVARFANRPEDFALLAEIDAIFRLVVDSLDNTPEWFEAFFLLRSHSAYLATVRLAASGQATESYATSRQCLEFALYGFYLFRHKNLQKDWLSRTESEAARDKVRRIFKTKDMFAQLNADDPKHGKAAKALYERTIDYGAHPNEQAITTTMKFVHEDKKRIMQALYMHGDDNQTQVASKTTAQVSVTSICIFRNVFKHRYDIIGVTDKLDTIKKKL